MKLLQINWNPSDRQLRQFGLITLVALPLIGWLFTAQTSVFWWLWGMSAGEPHPLVWDPGNGRAIVVLAGIGMVLALAARVRPRSVKPVFIGLCIVGMPIGLVVSELALAVLYFGILTPIALFFRMVGRDALERRWNRDRESYWQPKSRPADVARYFRQS